MNSVRNGFRVLKKTGETPKAAYRDMRSLYVATNGRSNDWISKLISWQNPAKDIEIKQSIIPESEISKAVSGLNQDGFYLFDTKVPESMLAQLVQFGKTQPCRAFMNTDANSTDFSVSETKHPYDSSVDSPKFNFDAEDLLENSVIQQLVQDTGFQTIAQQFLEAQPILDLIAMWWSQPCKGEAHSSAAQLYHFDMDRIKFVKFFVYLTDVTPETGPHCYVRGSSKRKPKDVLRNGRISDEDIAKAYSKEDILEICGTTGTLLAVDTRGFHKGKMLTEDNRLLLQFEMANSMFGAYYDPIPFNNDWPEEFKKYVRDNKRYFGIIKESN